MNNFSGKKQIEKIIKDYFSIENEENKSNASNNLCISGQWGYGKITFVQKLLKEYFSDEKYKYITFDLWEYEISDNAFKSLIIDMAQLLGFEEKAKINIGKLLTNIAKGIFKRITNTDIDNMTKNIIKKYDIEQYDSFKKTLEQVIKIINEQLGKLKEDSKQIIIVFDEMDRTTIDQLNIFLNVIKNIFFRIKDNVFFIVCCHTDHVDSMLSGKDDEPFTAKIFDKIINIDYLVDKNKILFLDETSNYLKEYWHNDGNLRKRNKIIVSIKKQLKNYDDSYSDLFKSQLSFLFAILYNLKYSNIEKYKNLLNNVKNISLLDNKILNMLSDFKDELTNGGIFLLNPIQINLYRMVVDAAPFKESYKYPKINMGLYVNIKKSWLVPLSFFIPFFYKWESFNKSSGFFKTEISENFLYKKFLILEYELIKDHILPEIKKGLDILIESEERNVRFSHDDIQIFYQDICKIILNTIFD